MKIGIGNDHHGVLIKQKITNFLENKGYNVIDYGSNENENVDYCDYAFKVGEGIKNKDIDYGILLCNTGIGMSIACNKVKGVRCAKVSNVYEAEMTRRDNDSNCIALSCRYELSELESMIDTFLNTQYANLERYNRRVEKIDNYAN